MTFLLIAKYVCSAWNVLWPSVLFLLHFQFFFPVHLLSRFKSLLWDYSKIFPKAGNTSKILTARKHLQSQIWVNLNVDVFLTKCVTRLILQSPDVIRILTPSWRASSALFLLFYLQSINAVAAGSKKTTQATLWQDKSLQSGAGKTFPCLYAKPGNSCNLKQNCKMETKSIMLSSSFLSTSPLMTF